MTAIRLESTSDPLGTTPEKFDIWGVVEVMGHKQFAGRITEQTIGGTAFLRIDVPEIKENGETRQPAFSKLFGASSIYGITPTDEATALKAARALVGYSSPLPVYIPTERQLPNPAHRASDRDWNVEGSLDDLDDEIGGMLD